MRFMMTEQNIPNPDFSGCMNQRIFAQEINSESWTGVKENIGSNFIASCKNPTASVLLVLALHERNKL